MKTLKLLPLIFLIVAPQAGFTKSLQCAKDGQYCPVELVAKVIEKESVCRIAWGIPSNERLYDTQRFRFEQMGVEPRKEVLHDGKDILTSQVWCIQDVSTGVGVNKRSGCSLFRYSFNDDSNSDVRIMAPKSCSDGGIEWLFQKSNLETLKEKTSTHDFIKNKEIPAAFVYASRNQYRDLAAKHLGLKNRR